jgi:hypothetical protein
MAAVRFRVELVISAAARHAGPSSVRRSQARRVWLSAWCVAVPAPIREPGEQYLEGDFTSGTRVD